MIFALVLMWLTGLLVLQRDWFIDCQTTGVLTIRILVYLLLECNWCIDN